jgi:phage/plasmid-like protein (TIGR03299 family)
MATSPSNKVYILAEDKSPAAKIRSPLGVIAEDVMGSVTADQVMKKAGLNWRVSKQQLVTADGVQVPSHVAILREDTKQILGVVGAGYEPLQNAEAFSFADSLVDQGAMDYVGAGLFNDGGRIFIQAKVHRPDRDGDGGVGLAEVVPGDVIQPYFFLANGHDGSLSVRVQMVNTRVVCQNTFAMALSEGKRRKDSCISIKHTKNIAERMQLSKELLTWAGAEFGKFILAARTLTKKNLTTKAATKLFAESFGVDHDGPALEEQGEQLKKRADRLLVLFEDGIGNDSKYIRGTAWAAVNAVTQYLTHEARTAVRGAEDGISEERRAKLIAAKRFESNLLGGNRRIAERAMELALNA